jgi:L-alanine-DL-glutamate epimerase-like enolase superfamily enzyme
MTDLTQARGLRVVDVERCMVQVPFRDRCRPWNEILVGQWGVVEVIRLRTNSADVVGYGETLPGYSWASVDDDAVAALIGHSPAEFLGHDEIGAGLQMACYDALGKALEVPARRLFGLPQVRDRVPLAWWDTKMPPEVLAEEAAEAVASGYLHHKFKVRPWFDVYEQVAAISAVTPPQYRLDLDWNEMLRDVGTAAPVLQELEREERVGIFETPIRFGDLEGFRRLRDKVSRPIADHVKQSPFAAAVRAEAFDGYVIEGGVTTAIRDGLRADAFGKPYWLQLVGPGLTTALTLQLGAVLSGAIWPSVTCLNIYSDDLIVDPITVSAGYATVPSGPGLGVELDEAAVSRLAMEPPYVVDYPDSVLTIRWPGGRACHYATIAAMWEDCRIGNVPAQERGARLEVWNDDGSAEFAGLRERALKAPVRV